MVARVGTLAVGTRITTLLTGRSGVVRGTDVVFDDGIAGDGFGTTAILVDFADTGRKRLHPDIRVRVEEVTH